MKRDIILRNICFEEFSSRAFWWCHFEELVGLHILCFFLIFLVMTGSGHDPNFFLGHDRDPQTWKK